jgi:uncharacterized protein (TIGR00730 family)
MNSLCVYCGANFNGDPVLLKAIQDLAETMALQNIRLIYGGGSVGVMGVIANEMLKHKGKVTGVIPQFLMDKEVGHKGLTEMIITENMHQRKQKMADLSDGFVILPGGFGTLEEFFEILTWLQLGLHAKPIGVLNLVFNETNAEILVAKMKTFHAKPDEVWFRDRNLT